MNKKEEATGCRLLFSQLADSILLPVLCVPGELLPKIFKVRPVEFFHRKIPPVSASNNVSRILDFDVALVWASFFSCYREKDTLAFVMMVIGLE